MLTAKQHKLLHFIRQQLEKDGISPSFEEMKVALGLKSKSGIHRLIRSLEERGFIRRLPNRARALEVIRTTESLRLAPSQSNDVRSGNPPSANDNNVVDIPLHGRIAAGVPIEAIEDRDYLPIPEALLGHGEHYALEVAGDSMIEAGILDGDYTLIRKTSTAHEGDIVVALVDSQDATLKYFHQQGNMVRLDPANPRYESQLYPANRVMIQGCLAGLYRRYS